MNNFILEPSVRVTAIPCPNLADARHGQQGHLFDGKRLLDRGSWLYKRSRHLLNASRARFATLVIRRLIAEPATSQFQSGILLRDASLGFDIGLRFP